MARRITKGQKIGSAIVFFGGGAGMALKWIFGKPKPKSLIEKSLQLQLEEAERKRDYEILSEQLEDAWAKRFSGNVADSNNYFPESFMANLINVRAEVLRKVAAHMGDDRISRFRDFKGDYVYRVISGLPKPRQRG